ncbi:MAG: hypothetical protein A3D24_01705 [Candidatus Blackburnbacteria bacterium RIFCSPHIGHO2_02_FULL_39_13]|uniref:Glycosyltransferase 2-like domain-containing protein n=1 Tax=Candidatus Blackburnbacteria bacterium RIFCSPLOWO2_01_FULL_40_20 TaxID=1797519 RepID=A0A1G1VCR4_9BACT|nr:MAG: Glycosyl transferase family 2 [Microgenomates group bacterium GW2011_GWA2_39_19]OGY06834.1 MAG: hypothetical protein A2694_00755 [Candidatus Blackburnbacteria bacterium RIFCSPHIGHO2_01_FULL_40_17]OGY07935.1 MAG: hypothetical protein A3D24_01705 [Candidatus Blackburnbacteria bacterium RIFCSPHIGHO2_02_FULL_39_13]OGY12992.1 MAG: hypothetical protein A3A77_01610 [Candidatus Blackburnbacteria bacterium RIFCSPLOWO2_01_FULL_40_20]HBL51761.1 glycosyltransferase family 2 protein [Candidatus Blac
MTKVFVIILNWNGKKDTHECLKSVQKLTNVGFQLSVVVVDNGSKDGSVRSIKKQFKDIAVLENKENLGYVGGSNVGVKHALENGADFVMVLNNDTTIKEDLIIKFLEAADTYKDVGIFSPKIYFAKGFEFHKERYSEKETGRVLWYAGGVVDWKNIFASNYGVDDTDIGQYSSERKIDFATGACIFARREVFEKVGLFNEKYYLYLEDLEFSQRAKNAGWKILFVPDAVIWHKVSQSSGIGGSLNDYFITRNRLLFGLKYAGIRAKIALIRESIKLLFVGREWQRRGAKDFYLARFGKGSWQ